MNDIVLKKMYEIKENPNHFLGKKSLIYLFHYIYGYYLREFEQQPLIAGWLKDFQEFIQQYYEVKSSHGWADIITFYENSDEDAFDKFYQLLEEFLLLHSYVDNGETDRG